MTTKQLQCEISTNVLKAALLFNGNDDIRGYLNGLCIEWSAKGTRLVATDGHRLICHQINSDSTPDPTRFVIPHASISAAIKLAGKLARIECVYTQESNPDPTRSGVTVVGLPKIVLTGGITIGCLQDTFGKFPDYERLIPRSISGEVAQFNCSYVGDLGKVAKLLTCIVSIGHNGHGPALVPLRDDTFAVLMPMRAAKQEDIALPEWF